MDAGYVLIVIGVIFSLAMLVLSIVFVLRAIFSENMKYKKRKKLLEEAVSVGMSGLAYWAIILLMYVCCWLHGVLDKII